MVAVIGDVHGCYYTLKTLVKIIREKYPVLQIYCVGDLVDRGNFSAEVIEFIISEKIKFTLGNHDYMFYSNMRDPFSIMARSWNYNGAETTLASYKDKLHKMDEHLDFILSAPTFYNTSDCFISHAGISAKYKYFFKDGIPADAELSLLFKNELDDQNSIIWTRDSLIKLGKLQVVGHTHRKEVFFDKASNALYIDTTAYGNNKLSAVIIEQNSLIEIIDEKTCSDDVNRNWIYE